MLRPPGMVSKNVHPTIVVDSYEKPVLSSYFFIVGGKGAVSNINDNDNNNNYYYHY